MSKPTYKHERFCQRCQQWVKPYASAGSNDGITTYTEQCPLCTYAVNFSEKRASSESEGKQPEETPA